MPLIIVDDNGTLYEQYNGLRCYFAFCLDVVNYKMRRLEKEET